MIWTDQAAPYTEHSFVTLSIMAMMTAHDYLLKFRKVNNSDSLENFFDHLNYSLTNDLEIINMYRAADHRRAELVSGGRLYDLGCVPKTVWRYAVSDFSLIYRFVYC